MNIPNMLTVARIISAMVFFVLVGLEGFAFKFSAALVFLLGSLTDLFDGYLARKHNLITDFGKIMDPIADKCLMLSAFFVFMRMGFVMPWAFWLITVREVAITVWRLNRMARKEVLPAETLGKYKTVAQVIAVYVILFVLVLRETHFYNVIPKEAHKWLWVSIDYLMTVAVLLTMISGLQYFTSWKKVDISGVSRKARG